MTATFATSTALTQAHAAPDQVHDAVKVSRGEYFDCVPFPSNPTESPITRGHIVCTVSASIGGPLAGGKFVGVIDGNQARWDVVLKPDGTKWSFDPAQHAAFVSVFGSGPQPTMRVVAVSNVELSQ
ncbi:hypothetical protein [Burkholderia cenocepacia]|uniref:hypothetical protein n=1 Tax=Burkholderia cenocepacia TaxID=95486 RepID=UPI00265626DA|nr:hypothetical protein [Burkholderia cenocepacia]MDN7630968.1 hypothetical protein [Burkholderia cenocepacia]